MNCKMNAMNISLIKNLLSSMEETLERIARSAENELQLFELSYHTIQASLQELKDHVQQAEFTDTKEEIYFFKELKPMFLRQLIYYMEVLRIEANKPVGNNVSVTSYYNANIDRIRNYFERNHLFYLYHRMGRTNLDEQYYLRNTATDTLLPEYALDLDLNFSTIHSFKLSKVQAYELVNEYLQSSIYKLEHPLADIPKEQRKAASLWTDTKSSLIELAYALHARGSVNHGKGDVKQIIGDLEFLFNIQVGNFYRTFQSMRIRKKNRTSFIDNLKESLEKHMDETDLNFS